MNKSKNEREIARLEQALRQERRANVKLRRRVAELHRELEESRLPVSRTPLIPRRKSRSRAQMRRAMLAETAVTAQRFRKRTYFSFLARIVADSSLFEFATRVIAYVRRLQVVHVVATVLTVILTTAVVSAVYVAALPFLIVAAAAGLLIARLTSHSMNRKMRRLLAGRRVRVFIAPHQLSLDRDSLYLRNLHAMVEEGVSVILVSPSAFSNKGLGGRGPYFTARREAADLYIVRRNYFFMLRRRVLDEVCQDVTLVY